MVNVILLVVSLLWQRSALPYMLAFVGHMVLDRMWNHTESFWWPIFGWNVFWAYKSMNTTPEMVNVYLDIVTGYPQVWAIELMVVLFFVWFVFRFGLYQWATLKLFTLTGQISMAAQESKKQQSRQVAESEGGELKVTS